MENKLTFDLNRIIGSGVALIVITGVAFYALVVFWPQYNHKESEKIEVSRGASLLEVAQQLYDKNVIDATKPFILAAQLMGYEKSIRAGVFLLVDVTSNYKIIHQLVNSKPIVHRLTLPEGLRLEQIADIVHEELGTEYDDFLSLCFNRRFIHSLGLDIPSLEGFLTPETYYLHEGENAENVIRTMVNQYHQVFTDSLKSGARERDMTDLEVVTLASIIEGEAIHDSERSIISAVYHNRLKKGMRLQADPTIQYIIKDGPRRLLKKDLEIDSPYNTYLNSGLPAGPINNPGKGSIIAAVYPADVDYLFFVATGDGYHTFTNTEKEHRKAKRKLQAHRRKVWREKRVQTAKKAGVN